MADLSDLKRGYIVSARMAGASVTKIIIINELFGVALSTVSKLKTAFEKGEISLNQNSWRKRKLSDRDRRTLPLIVWKD